MNIKGKAENSLPVPQFFSWISNCNEGSTEENTLINLDFFAWLKDEFGMQIEIYAMDAGNFDSPVNHYYDSKNKMQKKNFPNGFAPIVKRANELGITLGIWCGPDGFGVTPEEEKTRFDNVVNLCKNYGFGLLKFDLVCGSLREEKKSVFEKMIKECRKYSPELILLNHRLDLGNAQKYVTTFLWEGMETYIDVMTQNNVTAPHHRACTLSRGLVPDLQRLCEDHGVCISSCNDYFEDDLVLQAFNRALILSPEIYGNPWLLKDIEFPRLARLYNLNKKYAGLLVSGIQLPEKYGDYPVSRGNDKSRLITLRNLTWESKTVEIVLNDELGIMKNSPVELLQYHPTQRYYGKFNYGDSVKVTIEPFRSYLAYATTETIDDIIIPDCDYEVINEEKKVINIIRNSEIDDYTYAPIKLCRLHRCEVPPNSESLYEKNMFNISNDSLETASLRRAGKTKYEAVQKARDSFFNQLSYKARGCDSSYMYDADPETFFDSSSRPLSRRINGGCLRIDLGKDFKLDEIIIEYFSPSSYEYIQPNILPKKGTYSLDLNEWKNFCLESVMVGEQKISPVALQNVDNVLYVEGNCEKAVYRINDKVRYIRIPEPMERIYSIKFYYKNKQLNIIPKFSNNMMSDYENKKITAAHGGKVKLPMFKSGSYLAFALNGIHGVEGAYCVGIDGDKTYACPDRAPSYPVNHWNHFVVSQGHNYTYYMPLEDELKGHDIDLYTLICSDGDNKFDTDVYVCFPKN